MPGENSGKRKRVTLREVAREAGVSIKTVSRVMNGEPAVKAVTYARVRGAIDRLGYRPNELARGLKGSRSRTIGLVIADISNPFFADLCKEVEEIARARGYSVILCASAEDAAAEQEYVELLLQRRIDGLLLVPAPGTHGYLERERGAGLPIVALDRPADGVESDVVLSEGRQGSRLATEHLIGHGHGRVAFVGDDKRIYTARQRLGGYEEAMCEAGLEPLYRLGAGSIPSAAHAAHDLLSEADPPTAIFAGNSLITAGVLRALDERGMRPPQGVALVGFEDTELLSTLRPRLTLLCQPTRELGRRAAELLFERIETGGEAEPQRIELPTKFVINSSCGCNDPRQHAHDLEKT